MFLIDKDIDILMSSSSTSYLQYYKARSKVHGLLDVYSNLNWIKHCCTDVHVFLNALHIHRLPIEKSFSPFFFCFFFCIGVYIPSSVLEYFCRLCQWRSKNNAASFTGINMGIHQKPWQPLDSQTVLGPLRWCRYDDNIILTLFKAFI